MSLTHAAAAVVAITFVVDLASFVLIAQVKRKIASTADEIHIAVQKGIGDAIGKIAGVATTILGQVGQPPRSDGLLAHVPELIDELVGQAPSSGGGPAKPQVSRHR